MFKWLQRLSWAKIIGYDGPKRARTKRGRYKGDDKSTKDVNEAWEGGKAPKKKSSDYKKGDLYKGKNNE